MADKPAKVSLDEVPTVRPVREPIVLVAGGPDELVAAAIRAAAHESPSIVVEACGAVSVASAAAALRPFALVISQDIYAFDSDEFSALARDVRAELVVLKVTNVSPGFLEQALRPSLRNAFRRYRSDRESGPVPREGSE
jgi:hypothetical protein